jgi:iron complex outermembrane receptor protein
MAKSRGGRRSLFLAAAAIPLLASGLARADTPATPGGADPNTTSVSDVVVTATRQSLAISKVPESVSAFTAAKLEVLNVKTFADLAKYTPGVTFDADRHDVYIRGIDSQAGSGTTGIYIDDTPIQVRALGLNANNTLPEVFDLQRVEVLRGPQGTLFGAGSEGGTVRYITTQPSLTSFSANAHAEVATTKQGAPSYEIGAAAGGPIIADRIGFRISAWDRHDGGYIDRFNGGDVGGSQKNANYTDTYVLRGALTFAPTGNLTITPSVNYENRDQHNHDEYWVSTSSPGLGDFNSGTPELMGDSDHFVLPAIKIEWDAGPVNLISNTSYYARKESVNGYSGTLYNLSYFQHFTSNTDPDPYDDGTNVVPGQPPNPIDPQFDTPVGCGATPPVVSKPGCVIGNLLTKTGLNLPGFGPYQPVNIITNTQDDVTQEFRVQSATPESRLNWTAGLFYAYNTQRSIEEIRDPQLPALTEYLWGENMLTAWGENLLPNGDDYINNTGAHDQQIALFGDATYKILDQLKLNVGLRYAWTHFDYKNLNDGAQDLLDDGGVPATAHGSKSETPFTPKVSLIYQATRDDMIYATYSEGYRIGGATPPLPIPACGSTPFPTSYNSDTPQQLRGGDQGQLPRPQALRLGQRLLRPVAQHPAGHLRARVRDPVHHQRRQRGQQGLRPGRRLEADLGVRCQPQRRLHRRLLHRRRHRSEHRRRTGRQGRRARCRPLDRVAGRPVRLQPGGARRLHPRRLRIQQPPHPSGPGGRSAHRLLRPRAGGRPPDQSGGHARRHVVRPFRPGALRRQPAQLAPAAEPAARRQHHRPL